MPTRSYALEPGGPKRLELRWRGFWKDFTVLLDGQEIGRFENKAALTTGRTFSLPDGSELFVRLQQKLGGVALEALRNGAPLPGSDSDPASKVKVAAGVLYFIAGLNLLLGLVALASGSAFLARLGVGWFSILFGAVFAVLAVMTHRRSLLALIAGIVLFAGDALLSVALAVDAGGTPPVGGLIFRVILIWALAQGVPALRALRAAPLAP